MQCEIDCLGLRSRARCTHGDVKLKGLGDVDWCGDFELTCNHQSKRPRLGIAWLEEDLEPY